MKKTKTPAITQSKPAMTPTRQKRPKVKAPAAKCIAALVGHRRCPCGGPDCGGRAASN